jgi:hypothetical protein
MELDKLKLKRLCEAKRLKGRIAKTTKAMKTLKAKSTRRLETNEKGAQVYASQPGLTAATDVDGDDVLGEGKQHQTPAFVRHCVTAITEKPKDLARVEKDAPGGDDGSPFAICWAKYKGNKKSLAAKHAKGEHHTGAQYEKALATLREDVEEARRDNAQRNTVVFNDVDVIPTASSRHLIRYAPRG